MAGIIDIKAKPSPPAELITGFTLVSHGTISLDTQYKLGLSCAKLRTSFAELGLA